MPVGPDFRSWLAEQSARPDAVGDLARLAYPELTRMQVGASPEDVRAAPAVFAGPLDLGPHPRSRRRRGGLSRPPCHSEGAGTPGHRIGDMRKPGCVVSWMALSPS
jgi:hypothetical protein